MLGKLNRLKILVFVWLFFGCGADSDLLRDQGTDTKPFGIAYDALNKGVYGYKKIDGKYLGFDYYILSSDCKIDDCSLLHKEYIIFDGNITEQKTDTFSQLSSMGWHEKSLISECKITFNEAVFTKKCPDGEDSNTTVNINELNNQKIVEYNREVINQNDLKDSKALFTQTANQLDFNISNEEQTFKLLITDASKCYESEEKVLALNIENLKTYTNAVCTLDNILTISFESLADTNGTVKIVDTQKNKSYSGVWSHKQVYGKYDIIEITSDKLNTSLFIAYYDGFVRVGKVIPKRKNNNFLNKDAFNMIYTQLSEQYIKSSIIKAELKKVLYKLAFFNGKQGYKKISLSADNALTFSYSTFFDSTPASNWILTKNGLHRESKECMGNIFFNSYEYKCTDMREGILTKLEEKDIDEKLVFNYLKEKKLNFKLDDNDTFFDEGAKELLYRYVSDLDTYIFNPTTSLSVGRVPLENNVSELFLDDMYVSSKDKKHYLKILKPKLDSNGSVELYSLKNSVELNSTTENNSTFILNNIEKRYTKKWFQKNIGDFKTIQVDLNSTEQDYFSVNTMILMPFELSKTRIVVGENFETKNQSYDVSYLNFEGYNSIENNIIE